MTRKRRSKRFMTQEYRTRRWQFSMEFLLLRSCGCADKIRTKGRRRPIGGIRRLILRKITETRKVTHQNYRLSFHANSDLEVIERLNSQENVTDYIRQLVLRDIKTDDVKN